MAKMNLPSGLTLALGLIGGVLAYLNQTSIHLPLVWHQVVTFGLFVIVVFGVSPLVHAAFKNALHISTQLGVVITTLCTILAAAITTFSMGHTLKGVLEGVLAFLAFIGFGPASVPPPGVVHPAPPTA